MFVSGRHIVALSFVSLLFTGLAARDASAQVVGLKTGLQWSTLRSDGKVDPDITRKPGFLGGLYWEFGQRAIMGQLELLAGRTTFGNGNVKTDITSFEIPVLVRINFARASKANIFVSAGGAFASRLRARTVINGVKVDVKDQVEPYDLQWIVGAGTEIQRVLIDFRYTRGMRDIYVGGTTKVTTDRLGLSVGYGF